MATAGRILIMPKGTWNAETTYENLDMVAHSGRAWLAKKVSVGIEPSDANAEFWHDFLGMDVFTEENPPTAAQVGAVSLYADPVLSKSTDWDNLESGTYRFSTWGGSGGVGYPPINDVGICILFDTEAGRYMYCLGMNRIVSRYYESKTWSDWIEGYIPVTGGTLSGAKFGMLNGFFEIATEETNVLIKSKNAKDSDSNFRGLYIANSNAQADLGQAVKLFDRVNNVYGYFDLFGEHNKPSGSYTGNGSATSRTVNAGGIGNLLYVFCSSNGKQAIIGYHGGICWNSSGVVSYLKSTEATFREGVLTLATTNAEVNANGSVFWTQVL